MPSDFELETQRFVASMVARHRAEQDQAIENAVAWLKGGGDEHLNFLTWVRSKASGVHLKLLDVDRAEVLVELARIGEFVVMERLLNPLTDAKECDDEHGN